jgi:hypothetical protein
MDTNSFTTLSKVMAFTKPTVTKLTATRYNFEGILRVEFYVSRTRTVEDACKILFTPLK